MPQKLVWKQVCNLMQVENDGYLNEDLIRWHKWLIGYSYHLKIRVNTWEMCNAIASCAIYESVAIRGPLKRHIRSWVIQADILAKVITQKKSKHLVSSVLNDIHDDIPNNGLESSFPVITNPFHVLIMLHAWISFYGTRKIWPVKLLGPWEKKWQVHVHWVAAGNRDIKTPKYDWNMCICTQAVKAHSLNEILMLIVVLRVNHSTDLTTTALLYSNLLLAIKLKMVALKQSEPWDNCYSLHADC